MCANQYLPLSYSCTGLNDAVAMLLIFLFLPLFFPSSLLSSLSPFLPPLFLPLFIYLESLNYVAKAGFKLIILLYQTPKSWY